MIEIAEDSFSVDRTSEYSDDELIQEQYRIIVDGKSFGQEEGIYVERVRRDGSPDEWHEGEQEGVIDVELTKDPAAVNELFLQMWEALPERIERLFIHSADRGGWFPWMGSTHDLVIPSRQNSLDDFPKGFKKSFKAFTLMIKPDANDQIEGVDFLEYFKVCKQRCEQSDKFEVENETFRSLACEGVTDPLHIRIAVLLHDEGGILPQNGKTIRSSLDLLSDELKALHENTVNHIKSASDGVAVSLRFEFPLAVKTQCEQYLLYFGQFLKDLGVDATTDLRHDAAGVLFTVTPENENVALDRIRQALAIYLKLPSDATIGHTPMFDQPAEIQLLVANVQHLNTQLMMVSAIMRAQEKTIRTQEREISRLRTVQLPITADVLVNSIRSFNHGSGDDTIMIFGGLLKIKDIDIPIMPGLSLNLPLLLRRLRDVMFQPTDTVQKNRTNKKLTDYETSRDVAE